MMQTIRYGKARLARFEAHSWGCKVYTYEKFKAIMREKPIKRAGITSLRRR